MTLPPASLARIHLRRSLLPAALALLLAIVLAMAGATSADARSSWGGHGNTSEFKGVNWADPRDNYASDEVVPSGLDKEASYRQTFRTSTRILRGFRTNLGANTVRLPINPATVDSAWWTSYRGAIDAATAQGYKVILSYWESDEAKDGLVDDEGA